MFSLISNSPLSDVLAPRLSELEEFIYLWDSFTSFFSQDGNQSKNLCQCRIESTNLSSKLSKLSDILVEEQASAASEGGNDLSSPLEFALQNKVFETLSALAQADTPLGLCPRVMLFFNRLLDQCQADLIPHKSVHFSLNKLVLICGKVAAGPYESIEMCFLACLTEKLYSSPPYLNFFLTESFPLLNSLLSLLCSPDSDISKRAGNAIIILICLHNENADSMICEKTPFCSKIINQIITQYNDLPRSLNPHEIEIAISTFRNDSACHPSYTNSVRKFLCFLKWYIFFDMLIYHAHEKSMLIPTLLKQFKLEFLESCILPDLSGDGFRDELDALDSIFLTTVLLSNCLRNTESFTLLNFINQFLVIPDKINVNIPDKHKNYYLSETLLKRCCLSEMHFKDDNHQSKTIKLASATLQLFEDILQRPSQNVIEHLLVQYLRRRHYLGDEQTHGGEVAPDTENHLQHYKSNTQLTEEIEKVAEEIYQLSNISTLPTWNDTKLSTVCMLYQSLIPNELKFNSENDSDQLTYIQEAIKGVQIYLSSCYLYWQVTPAGSLSTQIAEMNVSASEAFNEGPFLRMIFDNLNSILCLPYEINLQTFSLLAKLSLIPDDCINEYLLDPTISLKDSQRSLFGILHKIAGELQIAVKGIGDLRQRLCLTKRALLQEKMDDERECAQANNEKMENILQSLIVLDEFCKELASIIFAKNEILVNSKRKLEQCDILVKQ